MANRQIVPLEQLLNRTRHSYNEIRLTGNTAAGSVKVIGFFIKVKKDGTPADPEMAEQIIALSRMHGLPLKRFAARTFPMPDQGVKMQWLMSSHDEPPIGISFNKNNLRYWISLDDDKVLLFSVVNDEAKGRPMTKAEATQALQRAEEELPADQLSLVAEKLQKLREKIPELPDNVLVEKERAVMAVNSFFKESFAEKPRLLKDPLLYDFKLK